MTTPLDFIGNLAPNVGEDDKARYVERCFEWMLEHTEGRIVFCTLLEELGFFDLADGEEGLAAHNLAVTIIRHCGRDALSKVVLALARKE